MKIKALASRYKLRLGEWPGLEMPDAAEELFFGRDPFDARRVPEVSDNLQIPEEGTLCGHNTLTDSTIWDGMRVEREVPLSPLFVRDLAGRIIYTGFGPEVKTNLDWAAYLPPQQPDGTVADKDFNPFVPLCTFPRFCRDVQQMEGAEYLEHVFLTRFRCLDMAQGFNALPTGADSEDPDDLVATTYAGANLYPYKVRLDTFYIDGYKLPQTQMLYARGTETGVNVAGAMLLGERFLDAFRNRAPGTSYEAFLEMFGPKEVERMYTLGCTVIPTFEACNGVNVVSPTFELEDYWPGRAVFGLHKVIDHRKDKSPAGTILQVVAPGYITALSIVPAQVIVSDGSGYISPNATDPLPLVPNMHLPHQRTIAAWRATWLPTHPEHFEMPALWGWELNTGRFLQMSGPLWDPLHYYYGSVDEVLKAMGAHGSANMLVPVPEEMQGRFYPITAMRGFDSFSVPVFESRRKAAVRPLSMSTRIPTTDPIAGIGYHPLPVEFEFELDPFWFPTLHPLNREQGECPEDLMPRIAPVIHPRVTMTMFVNSVDAPEKMPWLKDENTLMTPEADPLRNFPQLARYLASGVSIDEIIAISPTPFLSDPGPLLGLPADVWWLEEDENIAYDNPVALEEVAPGAHDGLWDMRQRGVLLVKFRHAVYRGNLPLYVLAWWYGSSVEILMEMTEEWMRTAAEESGETIAGAGLEAAADKMAEAQGSASTRAAPMPQADRTSQSGPTGLSAPEEGE